MGLFGNRYKNLVEEYCANSVRVYNRYQGLLAKVYVGMNKGGSNRNADLESLTSNLETNIDFDRIQPLEASLKEQLERAFDTDFSDVKIHTGPVSDEMARRAGAQAIAMGSDIYFSGGLYNPQSKEGIALLVHEMQHVLQYRKGNRMVYVEDIDELEAQADRVEEMMESHSLHNLTQPLTEQNGPLLNPSDQSRSLNDAALFKSQRGCGGNMDDFKE